MDVTKTDLLRSAKRSNDIETEMHLISGDIATVYASQFKTSLIDWGQAINAAIASISTGTVLLPSGNLEYTQSILMKSFVVLKGQGISSTILKPSGCHGITTTINAYLQYASIRDLSIDGGAGTSFPTYDSTKHGINWNSGNKECLRCSIDNVRITRCYGKGLYAPYDFNNHYKQIHVDHCSGNAIEIAGLNTCTLENCYIDYVADDMAGYRIYHRAVLISCNGLGGNGDYWGVFGRNAAGDFEDAGGSYADTQHYITMINCNIEDWKKIGCKFLYAGCLNFIGTQFYAPTTGTFEYYFDANYLSRMSIIDGMSGFQTKGATASNASTVKSGVSNMMLQNYSSLADFTVDGSNVYNIPSVSHVYDSLYQGALEFDYANIKGMSYYYLGGKKHTFGTAAPATGTNARGDMVYNTAPSASGYMGWVCTTAGTPGTWKGFGLIEA